MVNRGCAGVNTVRAVLSVGGLLAAIGTGGCALHHHTAGGFDEGDDGGGPTQGVLPTGGQVSDGGGGGTGPGTFGNDAQASTEAGPSADCPSGNDLVFVASEERRLYSFDPTTATFTLLGLADCAAGMYVNSMAIDRAGYAWINYGDGSLWKSPTQSPTCMPTGYKANSAGVALFGMGFSAKTAGSTAETLYIDDLSGGGLGYIDLSSMSLLRFGPFTGDLVDRDCELTGTGDARLFGFFAGSPLGDGGSASVTQIDPVSEGAMKQWMLPTVDTGSDWAFAFWGGSFYLFTADKYDANDPYTTVTKLDPATGSLTVLASNIGFRVVGAGVSTCAPVLAPNQ
ncbi:MAG TPA: hypothetical protein VF765_15970 [Polyangiaceae bacterium]